MLRDTLERLLVVERGREQLAGVGEEALAKLGVLGVGDVLDDVDRQPLAGRLARERRLGEHPVRLAGVVAEAAGEQRRPLLATEQAAAGEVVERDRRAVLVGHREVLGQLAGRRGHHLLDAPATQQVGRGLVGVDGLAALVVHGHRLAECAEDAVEPRLRGVEVVGQRLVVVRERGRLLAGARGDHGEQRHQAVEGDPVDRLPGAGGLVPEQAAEPDAERDHRGDPRLALGADDRQRERHEQRGARDDEARLDRGVQDDHDGLQRERDPQAG